MKRVLLLVLATLLLLPALARAYDFGDNRSVTLATKAWEALSKGDVEAVLAYTNKCVELYGEEAKKMQASLKDFIKGSKQQIFSYWALNDVGTCLFIQGAQYLKAGNPVEAKRAFDRIIEEFSFAQCWDPQGWFWKPVDAAKEKLAELEATKKQ